MNDESSRRTCPTSREVPGVSDAAAARKPWGVQTQMSRRRDKKKQHVDLYSMVELGRDRRGVSSITRDMVMQRDGYVCQECNNVSVFASGGGEPVEKLEICYRVLPEDGGNHSMGNLITLCVQCIRKRGLEPIGGPYNYSQWL